MNAPGTSSVFTGGMSTSGRQGILFTAFEPSGDDHASIVIAELRRRWPALPIYAWGGRKMEAAGATIIERTGEAAVMGIPGVGKILEHVRMNRRIEEWLDTQRLALHIPVDSPDANFPICRLAKERGMRVVHLVAPQLWAWREGRIKKLRRLSDLVLCVLPFEENWFLKRGMKARFVGHPLFDQPLDEVSLRSRAAKIPAFRDGAPFDPSAPRLALMPGSRPVEIKRSFQPLMEAFTQLKSDFPGLVATLAVTKPAVEDELRRRAMAMYGRWPTDLHVVVGDTDAVVRWCDMAIVASGTVTLQVAKQLKPMVTFYRFNKLWKMPARVLGRFLFKTDLFTLPNLIAGKRVVPELVPYFGGGHELAVGVYRLMRQPGYAEDQRAALEQIVSQFQGHRAGPMSADAIEEVLGLRSGGVSKAT
jgi:lipid-A-disaccharide synthase